MSLYDKASLVFSGKAAAGKDGKAYNIKPVEKLKVDEHVTNGGFDDDSSWTKVNSPTFSNGQVRFQASDGTNRKIYQTGVFEGDKTYKVSFDVVEIKEGEIRIGTGFNSVEITSVVNGGPISTPGSHSIIFKNQGRANDDWIFFQPHTPSDPYDFTIDNVSVREVEQKAVDFTMVRGSNLTATREAPSGLIEKGRENFIAYSNGLDVSANDGGWGKTGDTATNHRALVTSGQTGYDGSSNAFKVLAQDTNDDSSGDQLCFAFQNLSTSGIQTLSFYVKAGNTDYIRAIALSGEGNAATFFDLSGGGAVGHTQNTIDTSIESIGSGWFRVSSTFNKTVSQIRIYVSSGDGLTDPGEQQKATEGDFIYVMNAQLEQGLVATPYIHTTDSYSNKTAGVLENEPRYDYSGGDAALLLEPERRNLVPRSELFSSFVSKNKVTAVDNHATSPEGFKNAAKITPNTEDEEHFILQGNLSVTNGDVYTWSAFVKADGYDYASVRITAAGGCFNAGSIRVNLTNGSITVDDSTVTGTVRDYGNGWYRISATGTCIADGSGASARVQAHNAATGVAAFAGDGTKAILVYGTQFEKGSYPTSYIPTYGSAATRDDDVLLTLQDIPKVNLDKYTFFAHNESERKTSHNRGPRMAGNGNSSLMGYFGNTGLKKQFFLYDNDGGTVISEHTFDSFTAGDDVKYAFVIDNIAMTAELFINGVSRKTASLTTRVDASKISSGNSEGDADKIKSIMYFPEALSDAECVSLTTIS
jgi:hypothetical protein